MKKLFYSNLWSRLLMLLAIVSVSAAAKADSLGQLKLDTDYSLSDFKSYDGYFVAPSAGKLTYRDMLAPYSDADHNDAINGKWEGYSNGYSESCIDVAEGQTVYFYTDFLMNAGVFRLSMDKTFGIDFCSLGDGSILSCTGRGAIEIRFTEKPTFTSVKFLCEGQEFDWNSITSVLQDKYLVIEYASSLLSLIEANPDLCGKNCQVVVEGLAPDSDAAKLYNGDGILALNFIVGSLPTKLVSENISSASIDSWFRPSQDDGVFAFTFNAPIKSGSIAMGYGANVESDDYYTETPDMTIDGCTVTVDLRGKQRRLVEQTDESGNPCMFYFKLQSFIDENDAYIYSTDQGSLGSISFNLPYNLITTNLTAEFTPAAATELEGVDNIEIYFTPADDVRFDGVRFAWDGNVQSVTIPKSELTVEYDNYHGCAVTFAVPEEAKTARNVVVSLVGLDTPDGLDYTNYVTAKYNPAQEQDFSLTLVSPKPDSYLAGFVAEESAIKVYAQNLPADADEIEMTARIFDPAEEYPIYTTFLWPSSPEEGEGEVYNYAQTIYENIDFIKGVDYTINITVDKITYPATGGRDVATIGSYDYTIHGTTEAFVYSQVALCDITPNPATTDIISTDQNLITLTFDGAVTVTKAGTPIGFGGGLSEWEFSQVDADGNVWTVNIPNSVIEASKSGFSVSVWAIDANGYPVYKSAVDGINSANQNKDNTYFSFEYVCTVGAPEFVVAPENGAVLEVLDKIYVSYPEGIDPNWNNTQPISLYKGKGYDQVLVQQWTPDYFDMFNDDICVEYTDVNLKWCIRLDEAISEPGNYTFVFPNAFFNLGSEFNQSASRATDVHYVIAGEEEGDTDNVTTDPEAGSTVSSLRIIKITWDDAADASVDWNVTDPVVLYNAKGEVVCNAAIDMSENFDDPWNMLVVTLTEEITADGTYTLHIPAGKVLLNDGAKSATALNLTYIVQSGSSSIESIVSEDGAYEVYDLRGMRVIAPDLRSLAPGIYIINGKKVKK